VEATVGRRERKKLATRQTIADEAMRLFLERGYDAVTVAEIAEAADVAVSTVFKHFDSKEAIAFARDPSIEAELSRAVIDRAPGVSIACSLRNFLADSPGLVTGAPEFVALVRATPALTAYSDRMWSRHARAVAEAIEAATGHPASDMHVRAWARALVQIPSLVRDEPDRRAAIDAAMDVLLHGWSPDPEQDRRAAALDPARGADSTARRSRP
jgi:AcrR family transcriptional regulator